MGRVRIRFMGWILLSGMIASALLAAVWPSPCAACSCAALPSLNESVARSEAVFAGQVLSIEEVRIWEGWHGLFPDFRLGREVKLNVMQSWKGSPTQQIRVMTGLGGGDCGYDFQVGEQYLVFAGKYDGAWSVNLCGRTERLADAGADLAVLGSGQGPVSGSEEMSQQSWALYGLAGAVFILLLLIFRHYRKS